MNLQENIQSTIERLEKLTKGQKTAQKIVEAAARCISTLGVEKTSVTNIAKEAELKRSLIAYHFPKKAEIFYKVIMNITKSIEEVREQTTLGTQGREKLEKTLMSYADFFYENSHYFNCYLHFYYMASIDEKYRKLNDGITQNAYAIFKQAIGEMLTLEKISFDDKMVHNFTDLIYQQLLGVIMRFYTTNHNQSLEQYREQYRHILNDEMNLYIGMARSKQA